MRGCLVAFLVLLMVPFGFCAAVTHDGSVMLVPLVIIAPFFLFSILRNWTTRKDPAEAGKTATDKTSADPVFRGIDKRVKNLQDLLDRPPRDD